LYKKKRRRKGLEERVGDFHRLEKVSWKSGEWGGKGSRRPVKKRSTRKERIVFEDVSKKRVNTHHQKVEGEKTLVSKLKRRHVTARVDRGVGCNDWKGGGNNETFGKMFGPGWSRVGSTALCPARTYKLGKEKKKKEGTGTPCIKKNEKLKHVSSEGDQKKGEDPRKPATNPKNERTLE